MEYTKENKLFVGILAIVLGCFGVHKFILGYKKEAIIMLVVGLITGCTVSGIIGLIEGIMYLTKSDEEYKATYIDGEKAWF